MKKRILSLLLILAFGSLCLFTANATNPPSGKVEETYSPSTPGESKDGETPQTSGEEGKTLNDTGDSQEKCKCEKKQDPSDPSKPSDDPSGNGDPECLRFTIPFGQMLNEPTLSGGEFLLYYTSSTPLLFSPQGLHYSHMLFTGISGEKTSGLATGISREVTLFTPYSVSVTYQFKAGESVGRPINENRTYVTVLKMTDASGNPVLENPVYYDLYPGGGDVYRYSVADKKVVSMTTATGRTLLASDRGVSLDVVHDTDGILRQIDSGSDGLADIVTIDDYKYEIRIYPPENAGTKNTSGIY